jgi:hypothetical protein
LDGVGKAGCERGVETGWKFDDAIELCLVDAGVPKNDVVAADCVVERLGGLAEEGAVAVGGEEVKVFVDVVSAVVVGAVFVGWFWPPDLGWDVDEEGGS